MKKGLLSLYFVIFFGFIGYSMMITIFTPMFLSQKFSLLSVDASPSERTILLGIALFLYPFGQFLSAPVLGAFSDHWGRKKVLAISILATTFCYVVIALAIELNLLLLLFAALFLAGLAEGNVTIAQSAIADVTKADDRQKYFGYIFMSASLAYIVGPLIAGKLSDPTVALWLNPSIPFWIVCVLLFVTFLWIVFGFKETLNKLILDEKPHYLDAFLNLKNVFLSKKFRYLYLTNFCFYLAIFGFFRCFPMYLVDEFKMDLRTLSNFVAWVSVPIILVNAGAFSFLFKKLNAWQMSLFSSVLLGLSLLLLILPPWQEALWVTLFLSAFFIAMGLPACATLLSTKASDREQGAVMGNNQSLQFFAEASSGLLGGLIAAIVIKLSLIVLGVVSLIAAVLYFYLPREGRA